MEPDMVVFPRNISELDKIIETCLLEMDLDHFHGDGLIVNHQDFRSLQIIYGAGGYVGCFLNIFLHVYLQAICF